MHKLFSKTVFDNSIEGIQLKKDLASGEITGQYYTAREAEIKKELSFIGFSNKRRFVLAVGSPIAIFGGSILFLYFCTFINDKRVRKKSVLISSLFMFTGAYFIAWNLWWYKTQSDLPRWAYYASLTIIALVVMFLVRVLINGWMTEVSAMKKLKDDIIEFFVEIKEVHYHKQLSRAISKDLYDPEYQKQVKEDSKEFDTRLYDKAEEIAD